MKLTENFTRQEFDSKCGQPMPQNVLNNIQKLAENLQVLRGYLNAPIRINSGYRSLIHNNNVGGAKNSTHTKGLAVDIVVKGLTPEQVFNAIEKLIKRGEMAEGGLKKYPTFVHYDIRGTKIRF